MQDTKSRREFFLWFSIWLLLNTIWFQSLLHLHPLMHENYSNLELWPGNFFQTVKFLMLSIIFKIYHIYMFISPFVLLSALWILVLQRVRDMGWKAWETVYMFVPVANILFLIVLLMAPSRKKKQQEDVYESYSELLKKKPF